MNARRTPSFRAVISVLGYAQILAGVLSILFPALISDRAIVVPFPDSLLQSLDRLAQVVVVSAGIPPLDAGLSPLTARLAGVAMLVLGWGLAVAAQRPAGQPSTARLVEPDRADQPIG